MSGALIVCIENDRRDPRRHEDAVDGMGRRGDRGGRPRGSDRSDRSLRRNVTGLLVDYHLDRGNGVAAIREIRRRFGDSIPAILITADRSPNVRNAAREENIAVLNKPVKPASLRALIGQWRARQMVAAE